MRKKQDWRLFVIFGALVGLLFVGLGIAIITSGAEPLAGAAFIIMGLALAIGVVAVFKIFANANAGKKDDSIQVQYTMSINGHTEPLTDMPRLIYELENMPNNQEILITLSPEFFGLMAWKFTKLKNQYISFVQLRKKDKIRDFFLMPVQNAENAVTAFAEVFEEHRAVNTSNLIEMKRFEAVCAYYDLK